MIQIQHGKANRMFMRPWGIWGTSSEDPKATKSCRQGNSVGAWPHRRRHEASPIEVGAWSMASMVWLGHGLQVGCNSSRLWVSLWVTSVIICNRCYLGRASFRIIALLLLDVTALLILVHKTNIPIKQELVCHWHGLTHTVPHNNIRCAVRGWKALRMIESCKPMPVCQVR